MNVTGRDLIDPARYTRGYPHEEWAELRRESPLHFFEEVPGWGPYWAVTKHADICEISKRPDTFVNSKGIILLDTDQRDYVEKTGQDGFGGMRTIIEMDPPEHRSFRKVASPSFTPRSLKRVEGIVERCASELVEKLAATDGETVDFVQEIAVAHPLRILSSVIGVPEEDEPFILRVTNELFAADDPEMQREGESRREAQMALGLEMYQYFAKLIADRRAEPKDDLVTLFANAEVDGEPMADMETFGYCLIVFTAGHDTTRNAIAGGMHALIENPGELEKLQADPALVPSAIEEIVRWTSPVNYMKRTVAHDVTLSGQKLREGDELIQFYASANRDEDVFDDAFSFRVDRNPNRHLGFGIGEHFCLGTHLARRSSGELFRQLTARLESVELAGEVERTQSSFVAGIKHLPIRAKLKPAAQA